MGNKRITLKYLRSIIDKTHPDMVPGGVFHDHHSIIQVLGLDPKFRGITGAPHGRATGRTTRMLIDAAVVAQSQRVCVVGHSSTYTRDLNYQLFLMCDRVGISQTNIICIYGHHGNVHHELAKRVHHPSDVRIFHDHYEGETECLASVARRLYEIGEIAEMMPPNPIPLPTVHELLATETQCTKCSFYSKSMHLRCAPFPAGDAKDCKYFEAKT